ncbi:MAG: thioredoxin domain-containing protein [Gemmatimonadota bacterium]|nr:thioredoxin domain-containing protein [Gemmatimonadota bacterium]
MANRLEHETSPYLLQHADNPVDWFPWGSEAFARARELNKPILLSIGYAACHWCHVMERESFEDEKTARLMNDLFVSIKVDREERPEIDSIYMSAVQAMTGHGGWPMTMFLTPDGAPFYGGTYYPPVDRPGMPSFSRVLTSVATTYRERPADVAKSAERLRQIFRHTLGTTQSTGPLSPALLEGAYRAISQRYDARDGGFTGAPKFPQAMALDFLLRYWRRTGAGFALEMALGSFRKMSRGGICDQVGGGFHRYSVDAHWLVPHFEKMLYDNALLGLLGVRLFQATGDAEVRRVTEALLDWLGREMTSPSGGFYSTLDADSEGEEGRFYVWSDAELDRALGADARAVKAHWGVTPGGNFEGHNILHVGDEIGAAAARAGVDVPTVERAIETARRTLYDVRARRVWPARDEKILASWNGLMLRAVAEAARVLGRAKDRALAIANGEFLFREMVHDGRVMRSHTDGVTRIQGYLEDHAAVGLGALALYDLTFESIWLERARTIAERTVTWFWDEQARAFFDTAHDHEALIARPREVTDNATPSGTSLAIDLLLRLSVITDDADMRHRALWVLETLAEPMERHAPAFGHALGVADMAVHGTVELALVGEPGSEGFEELAREAARHYLPALVLAGGAPDGAEGVALLAGRTMVDGQATAYVCRHSTCEAPVTSTGPLGEQLEAAATLQLAP